MFYEDMADIFKFQVLEEIKQFIEADEIEKLKL